VSTGRSGILYALADADDGWHARAVAWLDAERELLAVPVTVLPEVCYLLATRLSTEAEARFVSSVAAGELAVEPLGSKDLGRIGEMLTRYPQIGFVDASLVVMAERLGTTRLATTDRRHFGAIRPRHTRSFELVP
jgi:predicted nucleic acid-binding protein